MAAGDGDLAQIGALLADRTRATMLLVLLAGRPQSASSLANAAGVSASSASGHLRKLVDGHLLVVESIGRRRVFRLANAVADALEALLLLAPPASVRSLSGAIEGRNLRHARLCYGHLAGGVGVAVAEALLARGLLAERARGYEATPAGAIGFADYGIDVGSLARGRRPVARRCMDWSERRDHLAGGLGAALMSRLIESRWVRLREASRVVTVTGEGRRVCTAGWASTFPRRSDMTDLGEQVRVLTVDIFGTTVDWWTGVSQQIATVATEHRVELDAAALATAWRERYLPSMARVRGGQRSWAYLDTLHSESLDELLTGLGVAEQLDEAARRRLVLAWHRLPAWPDAVEGLDRLRRRFLVVALSNGGFRLLTNLIKTAGVTFDAIISAQHARTYKPDPRVYHTAAELLDVSPERMLMVACHGWDLYGARAAGLRTAFVERPLEKGPDHPADRAGDTPTDLRCASFTELATILDC